MAAFAWLFFLAISSTWNPGFKGGGNFDNFFILGKISEIFQESLLYVTPLMQN